MPEGLSTLPPVSASCFTWLNKGKGQLLEGNVHSCYIQAIKKDPYGHEGERHSSWRQRVRDRGWCDEEGRSGERRQRRRRRGKREDEGEEEEEGPGEWGAFDACRA